MDIVGFPQSGEALHCAVPCLGPSPGAPGSTLAWLSFGQFLCLKEVCPTPMGKTQIFWSQLRLDQMDGGQVNSGQKWGRVAWQVLVLEVAEGPSVPHKPTCPRTERMLGNAGYCFAGFWGWALWHRCLSCGKLKSDIYSLTF